MTSHDQAVKWLSRAFDATIVKRYDRRRNTGTETETERCKMSISDRLDRTSESWRPDQSEKNHPDRLLGTILEIAAGLSEYGEHEILTIQDTAGNEWRWAVLGEVASKRVRELSPEVGDDIGVRYLGRVPSPTRKEKDGSPVMYSDWRIIVEPKADGAALVQAKQKALDLQSNEPF